ncbi:hypothetical protein [Komagataeibacter europaeus]|uniref:hypothetical protein n=1 Tax=Komagataeibacter europaeus TaxID=33995 RepID=UPI000B55A4D1|nr:hypothetical protein [Komagataeibacter europaeus]ARW16528.1 hypothetical protein S101446_01402 [Komagataeibacter europaeus]
MAAPPSRNGWACVCTPMSDSRRNRAGDWPSAPPSPNMNEKGRISTPSISRSRFTSPLTSGSRTMMARLAEVQVATMTSPT